MNILKAYMAYLLYENLYTTYESNILSVDKSVSSRFLKDSCTTSIFCSIALEEVITFGLHSHVKGFLSLIS